MRFTRLVIEGGRSTIALDLHPRLTIVTGVGEVERQSLTTELLGSLGTSRPGVHLEVVADNGRHLAVFRPRHGRHRIVDVGAETDVTELLGTGDEADLLAAHHLTLADARRELRIGREDLTTSAQSDAVVSRLADADQIGLWSAAARVRVTDEALQEAATATGTAPEDAGIIDQIEQRHQRLKAAVEGQVKLGLAARILTGVSLLAAGLLVLVSPAGAVGALGVGTVTLVLAFFFRARVARAYKSEQSALGAAGAESYLGFHLRRVEDLVNSDQNRRRLLAAAKDHRLAAADWFEIAGDVSVEWALEHHDAIGVAARLRTDMRNLAAVSDTGPDDDDAGELAHELLTRLTRARALGTPSASFPVILDEPFAGLGSTVKAPLLEVLAQRAGNPQVILLTDDEEVASWARLEALAGDLAVLEPTAEPEPIAEATPGVA